MERIPRADGERVEETSVSAPRGREAISIGSALHTQISLMHRMVPKELHHYIGSSTGQSAGMEDALFERWAMKYAHAFKDFCDEHGSDAALIDRMETQQLGDADYAQIEAYLADADHGGPFFTVEDLDSFMKDHIH